MWPKPGRGSTTRARRRVSALRRTTERTHKATVRERDRSCRFPWCGCADQPWTEVAHLQHKGMGGNPDGDRSLPSEMILLCQRRHQGRTSLHSGDVRVRPVTGQGTDGPVAWFVSLRALERSGLVYGERRDWFCIATEIAPGEVGPLEDWQTRALYALQHTR